jgi:predicted secreted acid phosphatase
MNESHEAKNCYYTSNVQSNMKRCPGEDQLHSIGLEQAPTDCGLLWCFNKKKKEKKQSPFEFIKPPTIFLHSKIIYLNNSIPMTDL